MSGYYRRQNTEAVLELMTPVCNLMYGFFDRRIRYS
jgi:hypothetical protein